MRSYVPLRRSQTLPLLPAISLGRLKPFLFCLFTLLLALPAVGWGETPIYRDEPSGAFMRDWLLCGPFPNPGNSEGQLGNRHHPAFEEDQLAAQGGEAAPVVEESAIVKALGVSAAWTRQLAAGNTIDLDKVFSEEGEAFAYAYCEVETQGARPCVLAVGSNDGCRIWLNGRQVWDYPNGRPLRADEDIVPVILAKGRNTLVLKLENRGRAWEFCCRLIPLDDAGSMDGLFNLFDMKLEEGQAFLSLRFPSLVSDGLLDRARVTVARSGIPNVPLWTGDIVNVDPLRIPIESKGYARYVALIHAELADGSSYSDEIPFALGERTPYTLFTEGATDYEIVVAEAASESEKWAARELSHWLGQVSGAFFRVRNTEGVRGAEHAIFVGWNDRVEQMRPAEFTPPEPDDESFTYLNVGPDLLIWGGSERGTMYGVFTFLEREFGCRWYTPTATAVPKRDTYAFEGLAHREKPGITMRDVDYMESFDPWWRARNKVNAGGHTDQIGGRYRYWNVHTFAKLMPPAEFFDAHPEYYSLNDGVRVADKQHPHNGSQLCLSNPEVLRIITERFTQAMREHPEYLIYSLSQNDGDEYGPCECTECRAIRARYGEKESGVILWFVNQVADAIREEFPGKYVGTLAYTYSVDPPENIKPRDNVVIRLCNFHGDFAHPLESPCNGNPAYADAVRGWGTIAPHLYIWDYVMSFSHFCLPFPNLRSLPAHIRFYRDNHALGYYPQALNTAQGAEFAHLRSYLLAKAMWNPDLDADEAISDFVHGYYGRSGRFIRQYIDCLHDRITPETHVHLWLKPHHAPFTEAFIREAIPLFDEAQRVADTPEIRRRVEEARFPVLYLKCCLMPVVAAQDGTYEQVKAFLRTAPAGRWRSVGEFTEENFLEVIESLLRTTPPENI